MQMIHTRAIHTAISFLLVTMVSGCITGRSSKTYERQYRYRNSADQETPTPKAGDKSKTTQVDYSPSGSSESQLEQSQLLQFVMHHARSDQPLSPAEIATVQNLPRGADPSSLEAAAVVLGLCKLQRHDAAIGQEQNLKPEIKQLEQRLKAYDIDLIETLSKNRFLRQLDAFRTITDTVLEGNDTPSFVQSVLDINKTQAQSWGALVEHQTEKANTLQSSRRVTMISAADLRSGDALLMEAQTLANQGRFKDALARMQLIPEENPLFPQAKERIKDFSNRAVSDLRQKAAQAFKSSIPVSDTKAKIAYLQQARNYLEQALSGFPEADHLTTVKENLAVITQDLSDLENSANLE